MVLAHGRRGGLCLDEKVVGSAAELDWRWYGQPFPTLRGGLCRWDDQQGVGRLVAERGASHRRGERFEPSHAWGEAASGRRFHARWPPQSGTKAAVG